MCKTARVTPPTCNSFFPAAIFQTLFRAISFILFYFFLGYWYVQFQQPSPVFLLFVHSQKVVSPDWEVTIVIRCVRERTT